jgi:hypothetical protein
MSTQWIRPTPRIFGLKFESNLVCAPCHHGKMIIMSHSPVNTMMTKQPRQLLHMDTVGPSLVRSMGGKCMFIQLLMTILITLGFSSWKARMKSLSTFKT